MSSLFPILFLTSFSALIAVFLATRGGAKPAKRAAIAEAVIITSRKHSSFRSSMNALLFFVLFAGGLLALATQVEPRVHVNLTVEDDQEELATTEVINDRMDDEIAYP